jgi:hypothetical protein
VNCILAASWDDAVFSAASVTSDRATDEKCEGAGDSWTCAWAGCLLLAGITQFAALQDKGMFVVFVCVWFVAVQCSTNQWGHAHCSTTCDGNHCNHQSRGCQAAWPSVPVMFDPAC